MRRILVNFHNYPYRIVYNLLLESHYKAPSNRSFCYLSRQLPSFFFKILLKAERHDKAALASSPLHSQLSSSPLFAAAQLLQPDFYYQRQRAQRKKMCHDVTKELCAQTIV